VPAAPDICFVIALVLFNALELRVINRRDAASIGKVGCGSDKSSTENVTWWDKSRVLPFMDDSPPPVVGTRLRLAGHAGTVRFVGNVDNTSGIWLGVEWDDPKRGKHDGLKDGKRYFTCR
jgi:hypothetical protein